MFKNLIIKFFSWYIKRIIYKDFDSFSYNKIEIDQSRAILLLSNHFSWWDGFLMFQLNRLYFKKKFHVMVSEDNYNRVSFLKYLGAFPVRNNSKSLIETLQYAGELLNDGNNLVLIFPQGKLYSNHVAEIDFQKGIAALIKSSQKNFQYLFAASFVDYFEKRKPSIRCYLQIWDNDESPGLTLIKSAFNTHYETSRQQQSRIIV
ncbi:lysophospholipid acyltransferase family protein [Pedobacter sp. P351]|uniref:lysophospholipid acyltransferase family protein n=1 Tax=Pedobacter superstes TaxID=3133441 RepID=UPI0030AE8332